MSDTLYLGEYADIKDAYQWLDKLIDEEKGTWTAGQACNAANVIIQLEKKVANPVEDALLEALIEMTDTFACVRPKGCTTIKRARTAIAKAKGTP